VATTEGSIYAAALDYAARGWRVLVLAAGGKVPIGRDDPDQPHGCLSATTEPAVIERLFGRNPRGNVGIATGEQSGIAVIDYDGPHAVEAAETAGLVAPSTYTVRTRSGGWHVYVAYDPAIRSKARILSAGCPCVDDRGRPHPCGLDGRAEGGYVVAPPSVVGGRFYTVARDLPVASWPEMVTLCRAQRPPPVTPGPRPAYTGDSLIERIKAAWTVEELAERLGAQLRSQGDQLKARCPLHREQRGMAFVIWRRDQRWRCFGRCDAGGDVIDLFRAAVDRGLIHA